MRVLIDWDRGRRWSKRWVAERWAKAGYRIVAWRCRRSPSGAGWHVVAAVRPVPRHPCEVVALQLLGGSDPMREANNLRRARRLPRDRAAARHWNVLYRASVRLSQEGPCR